MEQASRESEPASAGEPTLRRSIGLWQMTLYGAGSMLGAGIYGLVGQVGRRDGIGDLACFFAIAGRGRADGIIVCLARLTLPACGWCRLYHAARLSPPPAHPFRRAYGGLLGLHLDRRRRSCGGRKSANPARPRGPAHRHAGVHLSRHRRRDRLSRHPRVDVGQRRLYAGGSGGIAAPDRSRVALLGFGEFVGIPGWFGNRSRPSPGADGAGRRAHLLLLPRLRGFNQHRPRN